MWIVRIGFWATVVSGGGCLLEVPDAGDGDYACTTDADCLSGYSCRNNRCLLNGGGDSVGPGDGAAGDDGVLRPTAVVAPGHAVITGEVVAVDGRGSTSPGGTGLSYAWTFASRPLGSAAQFVDAAASTTRFATDVTGDYRVQLVVDDGVASRPATTTYRARPVAVAGRARAAASIARLQGLETVAFTEPSLTYGP